MRLAVAAECNADNVARLVGQIMPRLQEHLNAGPAGRAKVFEILNALAVMTSQVIRATGDSEGAVERMFQNCLQENLLAHSPLIIPPGALT